MGTDDHGYRIEFGCASRTELNCHNALSQNFHFALTLTTIFVGGFRAPTSMSVETLLKMTCVRARGSSGGEFVLTIDSASRLDAEGRLLKPIQQLKQSCRWASQHLLNHLCFECI